jgi:hypothetical protein
MARLIAALLLASLALTACAAENRKLLNWGESGKLLDWCNQHNWERAMHKSLLAD